MRCPACGLLRFVAGLCSHENSMYDGKWSDGNRAACDFFHRQIVPTPSPRRRRQRQRLLACGGCRTDVGSLTAPATTLTAMF